MMRTIPSEYLFELSSHNPKCLTIMLYDHTSQIFREFIEGLDLFVGRYLVLIASGYIILKFVHFKIFPDFP